MVVLVNGLPATSLMPAAPPVTVTVYLAFDARVDVGFRIHRLVVPSRVTVAAIAVPVVAVPGLRAKVVPLTPLTASLKVTVMLLFRLTPVVPLLGERDVTV